MAIDKTASIHESAVVLEGADIGAGVVVDPFAVIGSEVCLHRDVHVKSHAIITGKTEIGQGTVIYPFVCLGEAPENKRDSGDGTRLIIGARTQIREGVTINRGTHYGGGITRVGDACLIMAKSHIGHDCRLGNRVAVAPQAAIAGHCIIEEDVIVSGLSGIHQFVRLGRGCFIGAMCKVAGDVIPYGFVDGAMGELKGVNINGLKRNKDITKEDITALRAAFEQLRAMDGTFKSRGQRLYEEARNDYVKRVGEFILDNAHDRPFLVPKKGKKGDRS